MSIRQITSEVEIRQSADELRDKNLYQSMRPLAIELGNASDYSERRDIFDRNGWETDYVAYIGNSRPRFHAYQNQVAVEYIGSKSRARVRSDLLCLEVYSRNDRIDAGVLITTREADANSIWLEQDLNNGILNEYIFDLPIYIIETHPV